MQVGCACEAFVDAMLRLLRQFATLFQFVFESGLLN